VSERQRVDNLSFVRMALGFESPSSFKKIMKKKLDFNSKKVVYSDMKKHTNKNDIGYGTKAAAFKDMKNIHNTLHDNLSELFLNDYFKDEPELESNDPLYDVMDYDDLEDPEYYLD